MNMIARRIDDDEIVDPYGGVGDIRGGPDRHRRATPRSRKIPLRMLRAAQFAARFGYELDRADARRRCAPPPRSSRTVSAERVGDEIAQAARSARRRRSGSRSCREHGVLAHLWPELLEGIGVDQNDWHAYDVYRHNARDARCGPAATTCRCGSRRCCTTWESRGRRRRARTGAATRSTSTSMSARTWCLRCWRGCGSPNDTVDTVAHLVRQHMYAADPDAPRTGRCGGSCGGSVPSTWTACSRCARPTSPAPACPSATTPTSGSRRASPPCSPKSRRSACGIWRSRAAT